MLSLNETGAFGHRAGKAKPVKAILQSHKKTEGGKCYEKRVVYSAFLSSLGGNSHCGFDLIRPEL